MPLGSMERPQACLPSGGTRHMLLLATTSQFSLAHLKAIDLKSLRLAGVLDCLWFRHTSFGCVFELNNVCTDAWTQQSAWMAWSLGCVSRTASPSLRRTHRK